MSDWGIGYDDGDDEDLDTIEGYDEDDDLDAIEGYEVGRRKFGHRLKRWAKHGFVPGLAAYKHARHQNAVLKRKLNMVPQLNTGAVTPYGAPVMAQKKETDASLYQVFGLGQVELGIGAAGQLQQPFLERFKPGRLLLSESVSGGSTITGIFIGVRPQTANLSSMPTAAFGAGSFETRISFDTGEVGQPFTVDVTGGAAAVTVGGMAFGTTIKSV